MTYTKYNIPQMHDLHQNGKSYDEIANILGCTIWTVKYHLIPSRKRNQRKYETNKNTVDPLFVKRRRFFIKGTVVPFTMDELRKKLGTNPTCYLTGETIDLNDPDSYSLDHIIPISKGGKSSLDNLGLLKMDVNQSKYNMTPKEFIELCHKVVTHTSHK